jgi:cell fate (sporulation/competence/biofilm development) regulator YlbF (YheA/YmcA/DUF963 family)
MLHEIFPDLRYTGEVPGGLPRAFVAATATLTREEGTMMENEAVRLATEQLTGAIRESDEYRQYKALRDAVMENETNRTLIKEYQRTQTRLQMAAVAGSDAAEADVDRFNKLSTLLYLNSELAQYLVAQLRLQQLTGEIFQSVTKAAELDLELPGM